MPTTFATTTDYTWAWSPMLVEPHWLKVDNTMSTERWRAKDLEEEKIVEGSIS